MLKRTKEVQSACAGDAQVSQSVLQWKRFVRDIAYDPKEGETASPFRLFSVTIELAEAPPICLLVCRAFLHYIRSWMKTRKSGAACGDTTWKVNVAGWGLFVIAGMATHFVPRYGHRRCTGFPWSMTFGPKEDGPTLYWALKGTLAFYKKHFGVSLVPFTYVFMWDATKAGAVAHQDALPTTDYCRDLRRQIAKAKETAPLKATGDHETKGVAVALVIGSLSFSSFNLWTLALFHDHWEQVQAHLIDMGQEELVKWVKEHVLFWNSRKKKFDAHWRNGLISKRRPGESTFLPQVLESLHDTIKDALPRNIHQKEP